MPTGSSSLMRPGIRVTIAKQCVEYIGMANRSHASSTDLSQTTPSRKRSTIDKYWTSTERYSHNHTTVVKVAKQGISDRVVDESNPGQQFTRSQVQVLVQYEDKDIPGLSPDNINDIKRGCGDEDPVLGRILENHAQWVTKVPFTHESLLIDRKDYRLTRREKVKAKERYELDKRQSLYYQKNSYSDYYIKTTVPVNEATINNRLDTCYFGVVSIYDWLLLYGCLLLMIWVSEEGILEAMKIIWKLSIVTVAIERSL